MKKIFLFAAAAMVSLSSCVQTEDVYTGGLNEIGFKSAVTKAAIEGTTFTGGSMNVAAAWAADGAAYVEYFAPTKFTDKENNNVWSGEPARYWPNVGKMQFLAHFPYNDTFEVTYAGSNKTGAITGYAVTGIDNQSAQNDVLFSDLLTCDCAPQAQQSLLFHHAMTLIQVNFATNLPSDNEVTISSASVANVVFGGNLTVTAGTTPDPAQYTAGSTAKWSNLTSPVTATEFENITTSKLTTTLDESATPLLILPSESGENQTSITVNYTLNGHAQTKTINLSTYGPWEMGKKYIYNFTIGANEIKFTCTVYKWDEVNVNDGFTI